MNITELTLVQSRLNVLLNQPVCAVTRMTDMLCLSFGDQAHTLRIQCFYRMAKQGRIILGRNDVYQPSEEMWALWRAMGYEEDYIPEDFRSDEPGVNRLDECLDSLREELDDMTVYTVMVDQLGDMTVCFSGGVMLTIMADTSGAEECWRLIDETGGEDDLVVYGDGIELVRPADGDQE